MFGHINKKLMLHFLFHFEVANNNFCLVYFFELFSE